MAAGLLIGAGGPAIGQTAQPTTYVALGDSFTSGPLIPNQLPAPWGCYRSDHNYPIW